MNHPTYPEIIQALKAAPLKWDASVISNKYCEPTARGYKGSYCHLNTGDGYYHLYDEWDQDNERCILSQYAEENDKDGDSLFRFPIYKTIDDEDCLIIAATLAYIDRHGEEPDPLSKEIGDSYAREN